VRFRSPFTRGLKITAAEASGYLFYVRCDAETGKWFAELTLRGVLVRTRYHKHAWQAAAELEWQLARWCAHTGTPRSHYVSNAARLMVLGRADAAGVLAEAVKMAPWKLSRWDVPARAARTKAQPARRLLARAAARRGARAIAPPVGAGGPAEATQDPQPHIAVELEHLTHWEQRLVAPWLTDDLLDAMACRRDDEPPSPEVVAYVAILRAERAMRKAEQAVTAAEAAAAGGGGGGGDAAATDVAAAVVTDAADGSAGGSGGGWGGAIDLAIADAAAAEASGGAWQDAWDALRNAPAVVVPPEPSPAPAAAAAATAVGSKRRRGSGAESSEAAAARAGAGGRRRVDGAVGGAGGR
jgi:hypothetical protein